MSDILAGLHGLQSVDAENNPVAAPEPATPPEPVVEAPAPVPSLELPPAPPAADEPITGHEVAEKPDAVRNLIESERANARKHYAAARAAQEKLQQLEEAALPLEQRLSNAEQRAKAAEARADKILVGTKHGLPIEWAERLVGSTSAELEADAQRFAAALRPAVQPVPVDGAGGGYQAQPTPTPDPKKQQIDFYANLFGRSPGA